MTDQGGTLRSAWLRAPPQNRRANFLMCYGIQFTTLGAGSSAVPEIRKAVAYGDTSGPMPSSMPARKPDSITAQPSRMPVDERSG
jgi:hypothetical protein